MPVGGAYLPEPDPDRLAQAYAAQPLSQGARYGEEFGHFDFSNRATQFGKHLVLDTLGIDPADPVSEGNSLGTVDSRLPADLANDRYGVDGYLRFNQPTTPEDAAWQNAQAQQRRYRDVVLANTRPTPLRDIGAGLAGSLVDPLGLALMATTGTIGEAALGATGLADIGEAGLAAAKLGRVGNAAVGLGFQTAKGVAFNAPYVAVSGALSNYAGDDYSMGDGLRDVAAGAIFHLAGHYGGKALGALLGRARAPQAGEAGSAEVSAAGTPPEAVQALPPTSRAGAFAKAIDDMADDRPVDVGQYVHRELEPQTLSRLDEPTADPSIASFRPMDEARAVTTRGTEVPVRYGLVELSDLTTSHDDNLQANPAFPQELQPRDRMRAGAQARNHQLEAELNPKLLMNDVSAGGGAPIVSPDGVVESGNGRTIALRRSAAKGGEAYQRYVAELQAQGFNTDGMRQPALVRMRTEPMEGAQRAVLAREMNADVTERMSATEQAMTDAARLDDTLAKLPDNASLRDRDFTRDFIAKVAPDQQNLFADKDGRLSPEGERRIKAAVLARAYEDPRLVGQIFDGEDTPVRKFGEALADAAPQWARMRALAHAGEIPAALDLTAAVTSAMDLVRYAKSENIDLGELLAERLGQKELFGGEAISPATEGFLRLMYRDEAFKKPQAVEKISAALKDYARQAMDVTPGENLFGETPDEGTARQILRVVSDKFARNDPGSVDLRAPGRAASPEPKPVVFDLRKPGEGGDGAGQGVPPENGGGAESQGGGAGAKLGGGSGSVVPAASAAETYAAAYRQVAERHEDRVAEIRSRIADLEAATREANAVTDTRGKGVQYHGARAPITELSEGYSNENNIYGGFETFYTTDAADIASGYFRKSKTAQLYEVRQRGPVKLFDMEGGKPEAEWQKVFGVTPDDIGFPASAIEEAAADHGGHPNLRQVMDAIRDLSRGEGYSKSDVQEIFDTAIVNLQRDGYGGMRHIGGLLTDRAPHDVKIYFAAHDQLEVIPRDVPRNGIPAELQAKLDAAHAELADTERAAAEAAQKAASLSVEAERAASAGRKLIDADPELKALAEDTDRLASQNGIDVGPDQPSKDPNIITEALRAAALCLAEEAP